MKSVALVIRFVTTGVAHWLKPGNTDEVSLLKLELMTSNKIFSHRNHPTESVLFIAILSHIHCLSANR